MFPIRLGDVSVPTKTGLLCAHGEFVGPYYNERGQLCHGVESRFEICDAGVKNAPRCFVRLVMGLNRGEGGSEDWAVKCFQAVAPHIIATYITLPQTVPILRDNVIDVDKWLALGAAASASNKDLAAALDGGIGTHRKHCRCDVLRVLLDCYDTYGTGHRLPENSILESPLRRRFYEQELVFGVLKDLAAEGLVLGLNKEFWLNPGKVKESRLEVTEIERALLGSEDRATARVFPPGRPFQAWEELRSIIVSARECIRIEDAYLGSDVVAVLGGNLPEGVRLLVLGPEKDNRHWLAALASLKVLGEEMSGRIEVRCTTDVHDRYVYVDGQAWRSSESFKEMAKARTTKLVPEAKPSDTLADFEKRWSEARRVYPRL